ncbi:MAG TPA: cytochrome c-type biogenesis protein CcmH [Rickettsiales bacterium]|nr:cytochrome c-type biogenesis protein CcmH [Rickettsiales bacterium]
MKVFYNLLVLFFLCAFIPEKHLANEIDESKARAIFMQVKCLVCEAQSIESSDTEFSLKMRDLIRKKIEQGKSEDEIKEELVDEFGDRILFSPLLLNNLLIWILPFVFALILAVFFVKMRR